MKYCVVYETKGDVAVTTFDYLGDAINDAVVLFGDLNRWERLKCISGEHTILCGTYEVNEDGIPVMCRETMLSTRWFGELVVGKTYEDPEGAWCITGVYLMNNHVEVVSLDNVVSYVSPIEALYYLKGGK